MIGTNRNINHNPGLKLSKIAPSVAFISAIALSVGAYSAAAKDAGAIAEKVNAEQPTEPSFAIGDRLKISFYERVGSDQDNAEKATAFSNFVERSEISGDYTVQLDGTVFVPLLGKISVADQSRDGLEKLLASKAGRAFTGRATVVVRLVSRQPVYVAGRVPRPGRYEYTPGMVVLNALLLAGMPKAGEATWRHLDIARMKEHVNKSNAKLAELIAKRDALVAQRSGVDAVASDALARLVGQEEAQKRVVSMANLVRLQQERNKKRESILDASLAALRKQRRILTESVKDAAAALEHKSERLQVMQKLHRRRVITDHTYYEALSAVDESKGRWNDLRASIANLEHRIVDIVGKKSEVIAEAHISRERRIEELSSLITQAQVTLRTLAPAIGYDLSDSPLKKNLTGFTIIRRTISGLERINANRFTILRPGDIVEILTESRMRASATSELE